MAVRLFASLAAGFGASMVVAMLIGVPVFLSLSRSPSPTPQWAPRLMIAGALVIVPVAFGIAAGAVGALLRAPASGVASLSAAALVLSQTLFVVRMSLRPGGPSIATSVPANLLFFGLPQAALAGICAWLVHFLIQQRRDRAALSALHSPSPADLRRPEA